MLTHKESSISAYHNYLVNDMLTPGFLLGDPGRKDDFYFVADIVFPGEILSSVSARLFDSQGRFLLQLNANQLSENPGRCTFQPMPNGFRICYASDDPLLSVITQSFSNGYLTRIQGKLYDQESRIRMEPSFESIRIFGEAELAFKKPFRNRS